MSSNPTGHDRQDGETIAEARVAIHDAIERARELLCEAKLVMTQQYPPRPQQDVRQG